MDEITAEQIAQHYTAMGHSVDLINAIIAGKEFWGSEDMTAANAAITAGQAYSA
jgi:hypothetical protein